MDTAPEQVIVVWVTVGSPDDAYSIARTVVEERLAACVNIIPSVRSLYLWKGEICDDPESMLMIKTSAECFPRLRSRIRELHRYEVPEIIGVRLACGDEAYLAWVREVTAPLPS